MHTISQREDRYKSVVPPMGSFVEMSRFVASSVPNGRVTQLAII